MAIRILSANCQGLGFIEKRLDVLNYLKDKRSDIYCLQDTHTQLNHQNASSNPNGIMNASSAQAHLIPEVWQFSLVKI